MRIGHGYDVHRLVPSRRLILCGMDIPYERGLDGHSDADVAVHALMDALLGAAGMGDIGTLFPDTDPQYAGICSLRLLESVMARLEASALHISNVDLTIIAQRPKLKPFVPAMRTQLAAILKLDVSRINIKATTEEGLGFTGTGEGIACHAICLLNE